jgi:hypothetical protein
MRESWSLFLSLSPILFDEHDGLYGLNQST